MDLQKKAYLAIKAKCPTIIVVSGAPTPTGWDDGVTAFDDVRFLQMLYQRGLKDYSDAIGAHPSGFCNPPDVPALTPNPIGQMNNHRSWYFRGTLEGYREVMVRYGDKDKQIWATEFGWPVGTGGMCSGAPCHPAGQFNSAEQVANYFERAYRWAKQQGWVGVMFAWNLDFSGGEVGVFRIKGTPAEKTLREMQK
jgi:hypothetical protein